MSESSFLLLLLWRTEFRHGLMGLLCCRGHTGFRLGESDREREDDRITCL